MISKKAKKKSKRPNRRNLLMELTSAEETALKTFLGGECYVIPIAKPIGSSDKFMQRQTANRLHCKGFIVVGDTLTKLTPAGAEWLLNWGLIESYRVIDETWCYIYESDPDDMPHPGSCRWHSEVNLINTLNTLLANENN